LFGRNLTNELVIDQVVTPANGTHVVTWQGPRTYGITLGYKF
jgi:outer membrane receptor protein involved in Fe transport